MAEWKWKGLAHYGSVALVAVGLLLILGTAGASDCGTIDLVGMVEQIILGALLVWAGWLILRRR